MSEVRGAGCEVRGAGRDTMNGMSHEPHLVYRSIPTLTKEEIVGAIERADPAELHVAVLAAARGIDDVEWAQGICLSLKSHADPFVRGNAILGLGHLARIHRKLDRRIVEPAILAALSDPEQYVRGHADAAADDVTLFLKWNLRRSG